MKKHLEYMRANCVNDARVIINFNESNAIIYPSFKKIKKQTAKYIIEELNLIWVEAWKDHRNHDIGASMFVFKENLYKYGIDPNTATGVNPVSEHKLLSEIIDLQNSPNIISSL